MSSTSTKDEPLTLQKLNNHIVKTVVGCCVVAIISGFLSSYTSSFKMKEDIDILKEKQGEIKEVKKEVLVMKGDVADIKTALSNNTIYTDYNKDNIKSLQSEISDIKKTQDEMLKLMYDIKLKK